MSVRRFLAVWLAALTLFLGQPASFAHALTHLGDHDHAPDATCELCVGQAPLGTALPSAPLSGQPAAPSLQPLVVQPPGSPQVSAPSPSARAPPAFSA
ncbi:MAG: hypothetical protein ACK4R8_08090 [Thiobacillus sp.]